MIWEEPLQGLVDGGEATAVWVLNPSVVPPQLLQSPGQTGGEVVMWEGRHERESSAGQGSEMSAFLKI